MNHPFRVGQVLGVKLVEEGMLEATSLNSTTQHQEDALTLARHRYPLETEEDQRTVAAGIMEAIEELAVLRMPLTCRMHVRGAVSFMWK